jgi:predicted nucleic acid-binding Zn ribbon protein
MVGLVLNDPHHIVPRRRSEALRAVLHRALHAQGMRLPRRIAPEAWERAVGRQIAARAQPTVLSGGTLHVLVQDHRWRDQLDAARLFLLEGINRAIGGVRELQFGLAHSGALCEGRRRAGIGAVESPQVLLDPGQVLGDVRLEPVLREALLRAAEAASRRRACAV